MNDEQNVAYVNAQVACALIEMEAMKAENLIKASRGLPPLFGTKDFNALIEKYGIHYNAVITQFYP